MNTYIFVFVILLLINVNYKQETHTYTYIHPNICKTTQDATLNSNMLTKKRIQNGNFQK